MRLCRRRAAPLSPQAAPSPCQGHGEGPGAWQSRGLALSTHSSAARQGLNPPGRSPQPHAAPSPLPCLRQAVPCHQPSSAVGIYRHFWCPALQIRFLLCLSLRCRDGRWLAALAALSSRSPAPSPPRSSCPCSSAPSHPPGLLRGRAAWLLEREAPVRSAHRAFGIPGKPGAPFQRRQGHRAPSHTKDPPAPAPGSGRAQQHGRAMAPRGTVPVPAWALPGARCQQGTGPGCSLASAIGTSPSPRPRSGTRRGHGVLPHLGIGLQALTDRRRARPQPPDTVTALRPCADHRGAHPARLHRGALHEAAMGTPAPEPREATTRPAGKSSLGMLLGRPAPAALVPSTQRSRPVSSSHGPVIPPRCCPSHSVRTPLCSAQRPARPRPAGTRVARTRAQCSAGAGLSPPVIGAQKPRPGPSSVSAAPSTRRVLRCPGHTSLRPAVPSSQHLAEDEPPLGCHP